MLWSMEDSYVDDEAFRCPYHFCMIHIFYNNYISDFLF
jgi:hypothetical protein